MKSSMHYILMALTAVISICQFVAGQFPQYAALAHAIAQLATSLMLLYGVLSPSAAQAATALVPTSPSATPAPGVQSAVAAATAAGAAELEASKPVGQ